MLRWLRFSEIMNYYNVVTCPPLSLDNGQVAYNTPTLNGGYPVDTEASISCNQYHQREGPNSVICQNSGNWSPQMPTCNASKENNISNIKTICFIFLTNLTYLDRII